MSYGLFASQLKQTLNLTAQPIGVAFTAKPPQGVSRFKGQVPSGCSFWRRAADAVFYTTPEDHYNCPIGTVTHGFQIPPEKSKEAQKLLNLMVESDYITEEEFNQVPKAAKNHSVVVYGPLDAMPCEPDVVLLIVNAHQLMMLSEATAGLNGSFPNVMGRPTCAAIPQAMNTGSPAASTGCIGARVYADLAPSEMVFTIPFKTLPKFLENLEAMAKANRRLEEIHRQKKAELSTA